MRELFGKRSSLSDFFREARMPQKEAMPQPEGLTGKPVLKTGEINLPPEIRARMEAEKQKKAMADKFSNMFKGLDLAAGTRAPDKNKKTEKPGATPESTEPSASETQPQGERVAQEEPTPQPERGATPLIETENEKKNTPSPSPEKPVELTSEQLLGKMETPLKAVTKKTEVIQGSMGTEKRSVFNLQPSTEFLKLLPENGGTLKLSAQDVATIRDDLMGTIPQLDAVFNDTGKITPEFNQFTAQLFKTMVLMKNGGDRYGALLTQIGDAAEAVATKAWNKRDGVSTESVTKEEREEAIHSLIAALPPSSGQMLAGGSFRKSK
jgi:hypothetical protein